MLCAKSWLTGQTFSALAETGLSGAVLYHLFSRAQAHADDDVLRMTLSCGLHVVIVRDDPLTRGVMLYGDNRYNGRLTSPPNVNLRVGASNAGFKELLSKS
ncbi:hypothetical protein [Tanticharoenia sakaeratensis]|uniref:Uncharacterized protein n=1 Tax=Tanticharoenia sakaeratensis NBRC 103193 TaxID=1231623 RepID=A0A0D6MPM1_9PROT|nr:hypothetical protein [Tanticharoenia sakaeratensis]GAN55325.1 hypothetical protein Tasa_046_007 [Tanticharoenia sakaeratensis NBRC 103193]GBQ24634.1 hypothetical protein AA103193_2804 [Tanticharoenia sakaeratensis NBRC 103193]